MCSSIDSHHIDKFIEHYNDLINYLEKPETLSCFIDLSDNYRKILLLSCASFYESQITELIKDFVRRNSSTDTRIFEFTNNRAISRQYHKFFSWNEHNINNFLGMFGSEFKDKIAREIRNNDDLQKYVRAFLEIGRERNKMVHENFLEYKLDKTFQEIINLHNDAIKLIEYFKTIF